MELGERIRTMVDSAMARHRWILCADVAAAFTPLVTTLSRLGAPRPLVLAGSTGVGPLPDSDQAELVLLGSGGTSNLDTIRRYQAAIRDLPREVLDRIGDWDTERTARVMTPFTDTAVAVAGRLPWGGRPEAWAALEDKTAVDSLWDAVGIDRAPSVVVPATRTDLEAASRSLDKGNGTVWAADNLEGWHGGAEYTRLVSNAVSTEAATAFMTAHARSVRVMPYLAGIPCSIHAFVFPDDATAVFRPVEMLVFRRPASDQFFYTGTATSWDPGERVRHDMRQVGRQVGEYLGRHIGFRGALTVDGVATADGFRPTELNPRFGAGLWRIAAAADLPLLGLSQMLVADEVEGLTAAELEALVLSLADHNRGIIAHALSARLIDQPKEQRVTIRGKISVVEEGGEATLAVAPAPAGGTVRFTVDPEAVTPGPSAAPLVAAAFALADELWGTDIAPLIPADDAIGAG